MWLKGKNARSDQIELFNNFHELYDRNNRISFKQNDTQSNYEQMNEYERSNVICND